MRGWDCAAEGAGGAKTRLSDLSIDVMAVLRRVSNAGVITGSRRIWFLVEARVLWIPLPHKRVGKGPRMTRSDAIPVDGELVPDGGKAIGGYGKSTRYAFSVR